MISREEFKEALGEKALTLSEEDIEKLRVLMDQAADVLFDIWNTEITEENENTDLQSEYRD